MEICPYCHNTGQSFYALHDMKKGDWGLFGVTPCTKCKYGVEYSKVFLQNQEAIMGLQEHYHCDKCGKPILRNDVHVQSGQHLHHDCIKLPWDKEEK